MKDHCYIDLDGVVADFVTGLCDKLGIFNPYLYERNLGEYEMAKMLGVDWTKEVLPLMDGEFFANLDLMPDAHAIMAYAKGLCKRRSFLTVVPNCPGAADGKKAWVEKHFPGMPLILVADSKDLHGDKSNMANSRTWLIDDRPFNVIEFRKGNGKGILVPRAWNSLHKYAGSDEDTMRCLHKIAEMYGKGTL